MTFAEWMGQNGYSAYNSAAGRKQLQQKYGITGDSYTANLALWKKLREEQEASQRTAEEVQRYEDNMPTMGVPLLKITDSGIVKNTPGLQAAPAGIAAADPHGGLYVGNVLGTGNEIVINPTQAGARMNETELWQWFRSALDNPTELFKPEYYKTRESIPDKWWKWAFEYKDENGDKPYAYLAQSKKISDKNKAFWDKYKGDERDQKRMKHNDMWKIFNNPDKFFSAEYTTLRESLTPYQWATIIKRNPQYLTNEAYRRFIPSDVTAKGRELQAMLGAREARDGMNEAAMYTLPIILGAFNPLMTMGTMAGGALTDQIVFEASDGRYNNWSEFMQDAMHYDENDPTNTDMQNIYRKLMAIASNPGALAMSGIGGAALNGVGSRSAKVRGEGSLDMVKTHSRGLTTEPQGLSYHEWINSKGATSQVIPKNPRTGLGRRTGSGGPGHHSGGQRIQTEGGFAGPLRESTGSIVGEGTLTVPVVEPGAPLYTPYKPGERVESAAPITEGEGTILPTNWRYQTAYWWGKPHFVKWWQNNAVPQNSGKTLNYTDENGNTRRILIKWGGRPIVADNIQDTGKVGPQEAGTVKSRRVHGEAPIAYDGPLFYGTQIGLTPSGDIVGGRLGEVVEFRNGGRMGYAQYLQNDTAHTARFVGYPTPTLQQKAE